MLSLLRTALLTGLAAGALAGSALAQEPKVGKKWYEDPSQFGFRFKSPEGWNFIPPQPGTVAVLGQYTSPSSQFLVDKNGRYWDFGLWIVTFDRRPKPEAKADKKDDKDGKIEVRISARAPRSVSEWVEDEFSPVSPRLTEEKPGRVGKLDTVETTFTGMLGEKEVRVFTTLFHLKPDVDVALIFNGPGDRNWPKWERSFKKICDTFVPLDVKEVAVETGPRSLRDRKRDELAGIVSSQPGWRLYETENYFFLSSNKDAEFLEELMQRLEAIRTVYVETYPPALAIELRRKAAIAKREAADKEAKEKGDQDPKASKEGEGANPAQGEAEEPESQEEGRTVAASADPMEQARTSVVRICQDRDEYTKYGGPPGTAGYWSPGQKELVVFDDKAVGGRGDTWATLNHEAFHQYIFYFFGSLTPHYWYNEGTGDFYAGYEYKNKRFTLKPFDWRQRQVQDMVRNGSDPAAADGKATYVPLEKFVRFDREKYYDPKTRSENYAQGWALVYFLRTGGKQASCWNKAWDPILDTYLRVLVETDDLDEAVDTAFAGVDWNEFERCWKEYTLQ